MADLSRKDRQIADEWVRSFDPHRCALSSGKKPKTSQEVETAAHQVLRRQEVQDYISEEHQALNTIYRVERHFLVKSLVPIAKLDTGDFFNKNWALKDVRDLTEEQRKCIKKVKVRETYNENTGVSTSYTEIEWHDKQKAIDQLDRLFGISKQDLSSVDEIFGGISKLIEYSRPEIREYDYANGYQESDKS